jgi:hypothetical protein
MPNNNNPNQSGKGPANTASSVGANPLPNKITNVLDQAKSGIETLEQRNLNERLFDLEASVEWQTHLQFPGEFEGKDFGDAINKKKNSRYKITKRLNDINENKRDRYIEHVSNTVKGQFSSGSINGQTESRLSDPEIQRQIRMQSNSLSPQEVHSEMNASSARLSGYEQQLQGIVQKKLIGPNNVVDPEQEKEMVKIFRARDEELSKRATLTGVAKFHKAQGKDPMSQTLDDLGAVAKANTIISSGGAGGNEAKKVLEAFEALNQVIDNTSQEFKDLSGNLDKAKTAMSAAAANPTVGPFTAKTWGQIGAWGAIASTIGGGISAAGVDHRIADRQNIGTMAGLENSKYAMYKAARHGDIASQLAMSNWGASGRFGEQVKHTSQVGEGLQVGGNMLVGAAKAAGAFALGSAAVAAGATGVGTPLAIALGSGALALGVSAATDFGVGSDSLVRGIKSGQNYAKGVSSDMEARKQINAIPAEQMQGLRDFYVGAGTVSMGMGSNGEGFLKQMTDAGDSETVRMMKARNGDRVNKGMLENMADAGISPEQMIQMADLGNKALGSQFTQLGGANLVIDSRKFEKAGLGSMQENMQRMGQLSASGSNNPQAGLESVMASAMTKGLDNSKALGMMVDNTAALVGASGVGGAGGIDTTNVVSAQLASMVDQNSATKEFDLARAKTATDIARASDTNVSTTFSGMMNTSRISALTGLEGVEAITAGETDISQWKKMQDMAKSGKAEDIAKAGEFARSRGMNIKNQDILATSTKMIDLKQRQIAEGSGTANAVAGGITDEQFAQLKGDNIKDGDANYQTFAQIASRTKYKTVQEYQKAVKAGDIGPDPKDELNAKIAPKDGDTKTLQEQMDALRTGGFTQLSEAAQSAATALKDIGGAVKIFTDLNEKYKKDGPATEKESSTAAGIAADKFQMGADKFGPAVDKLDIVLNNIIAKSGMYVPPVPDDKTVQTSGGRKAQ